MKYLLLCLSLFTLSACTSVQKATRINTTLRSAEFNSVASSYMDRPTSVELEAMSDGKTNLLVSMSTYGRDQYGQTTSQIRFLKERAAEYVAAIDKFLEWAALAKERNDMLTKDITKVPTWAQVGNADLKFTLHSGNSEKQFLAIASCYGLVCNDDRAHFFDVTNARKLKEVLQAYAAGKLAHTDFDSVYK